MPVVFFLDGKWSYAHNGYGHVLITLPGGLKRGEAENVQTCRVFPGGCLLQTEGDSGFPS